MCTSRKYKRGRPAVGNIDQDEFAGATSSAGTQTAETFGGERQATLPEDLRRAIRRLRVQVYYESVKGQSSAEAQTGESLASVQTVPEPGGVEEDSPERASADLAERRIYWCNIAAPHSGIRFVTRSSSEPIGRKWHTLNAWRWSTKRCSSTNPCCSISKRSRTCLGNARPNSRSNRLSAKQ
jgi:hypothetical protein